MTFETATFEYNITNCISDKDTGIINCVECDLIATNDNTSFTHTFYTTLPPPSGNPIPYTEVTPIIAIDWIKSLQGNQNELDAYERLVAYKASLDTTTGLPWNTNTI